MRNFLRNNFVVFVIMLFCVAAVAPGCGGGGSAKAPFLTTSPGMGSVNAVARFSGVEQLRRSASAATGTVMVDISISGYYSVDNTVFDPVSASVVLDLSAGHARISSLSVPIGKNHVMAAKATYPDGTSETIKALIPEVVEGTTQTVEADTRSTVITNAAVSLASKSFKILPDISATDIQKLATAVDYLYSKGTPYSQMQAGYISDITGNSSIAVELNMYPSSATLGSGETQQFTTSIINIYGEAITPSISWQVSGNAGTISQSGLFTAGTIGNATITATAGSVSDTSEITVTEGSVSSISVSPSQNTVTAGDTVQFTATAVDSGGNSLTVSPVWTASSGGTIDSSGLFTSSTAGTFTVSATVNGISGSTTVTVTPGPATSMTVTPDPASVVSGATLQFTATGLDANGNETSITPTWSISGIIGTINSSGLFTAASAGSGTVSAQYSNLSQSVQVTVIAGSITAITVSPSSISAVAGTTVQFTSSATDSNGNVLNVTPTWTVSGGIGTVNSSGLFTATTTGTGTVTASQGGVSGSSSISVSAGALATINVSPSSASLSAGDTLQLTASGLDASGNSVSFSPTWTVSGGGSISTGGLYSATTAGSPVITASSGSVTDSANLSVTAGPLSTITISPSSTSITSGQSTTFAASGADSSGNSVSISPTWTVSGGIGTISSSGQFTGTTAGTGSVIATSGSVTASANVSVSAGPAATITVTPSSATIALGGAQIFTAQAYDSNGNSVSISETWSVSGGIGSVTTSGAFSASTKGTGTVTATSGGVSGSASITVPNSSPTASAGSDMTTYIGAGVSIAGSGSDPDGDSLTYAWTQSGPATLSISGNTTATPSTTPSTAGTYTLTLTVSDGTVSTSDSMTLTVMTSPVPTISSITPDNGNNSGTTSVTISGANFLAGATVSIGGTAATGVSVVSATSITATVPAAITPGLYDVIVTNPDSQTATLNGAFSSLGTGTTHSGIISTTQTWLAADSPHIITADVTVAGTCNGPVLTIEAGAVVRFDAGTALNVGTTNCGSLIADGTGGTILFTSNASTPAAGDWNGIVVGAYTGAGTLFDNVIIEYGGISGGNLSISVTTPAINNSIIRYSSDRGILFNDGGGTVGFTGNTIYGNTYPIDIYGEYLSTIDSGNTLTGNTNDIILVQSDTVTTNGTWANNGIPLEAQGVLTLSGSITTEAAMAMTFLGSVTVAGTCNGPVLTIGSGSTLMFGLNVALNIGTTNCGSLIANGSTGAITMTSAMPSPAPGDWEGINFGVNTRTGTLLDNVVVEYAGYGASSAIDVTVSYVAIQNSTIRYSAGSGITFADNYYPPTFTGNTLSLNASYPLNIFANFLHYISPGNTFTGNTIDEIQVYADTVTSTSTWNNHDVPLYFNGSVYIVGTCNGPVVTVEAGNTLKFENGSILEVGTTNCGSIVANGTGGTITFTSAASSPSAGDWQGISLGTYTRTGTILNNVIIEYGGATQNANLTVSANTATISNNIIRNGIGAGIEFKDGGGGMSIFTGNTITGNTTYPIDIYGEYMYSLQAGNTLTGNGSDAIFVRSDSIATPGTWANNGVPIDVNGALTFSNSIIFAGNLDVTFGGNVDVAGTCNGPSLTIGAGDILRFAAGTGLDIGTTNCGTLVANGTSGQITFTSSASTPAPGDWRGIRFGTNARSGTLLNNVEVSYAGNTNDTGVWFNGTTYPSVDSSDILYTSGTGVKFDDNTYPTSFNTNTITGSIGNPIEIYGDFMYRIPAGNTLTGNATDTVKVYGDAITTSSTWQNVGIPYEVMGDLTIAGTCNGPVVTIDPGVTMKFHNNAGLYVGTTNCGTLHVDGNISDVTFTSIQPTPAPGDWDGIQFGTYSRTTTSIAHAIVAYGGANGFGNIYLNNTSTNVSLTYLAIDYSSAYGIYPDAGSTFASIEMPTIVYTGNLLGSLYAP